MNQTHTQSLFDTEYSILDYDAGVDQEDISASSIQIPCNESDDFEWDCCFGSIN